MTGDLVLLPRIWPAMAPTTAPPTTFCTSFFFGSWRTRSMSAWATDAVTGYVWPAYEAERTASAMRILSLTFSLRFRVVTSRLTVAPAGIVAPLDPVTGLATVAVKLCPTVYVLVHTRALERSASVVPEAMVPTDPPALEAADPVGFRVTVFPVGVVTGADTGGVVRAGLRAGAGLAVVVRARAGAGAAPDVAGLSLCAGCDVVSRFASARSLFSAVSLPCMRAHLFSGTRPHTIP